MEPQENIIEFDDQDIPDENNEVEEFESPLPDEYFGEY